MSLFSRRGVLGSGIAAVSAAVLGRSVAAAQSFEEAIAAIPIGDPALSSGYRIVGDGTLIGSEAFTADGSRQLMDIYRVDLSITRDAIVATIYQGDMDAVRAAFDENGKHDLLRMPSVRVLNPSFLIVGGIIEE